MSDKGPEVFWYFATGYDTQAFQIIILAGYICVLQSPHGQRFLFISVLVFITILLSMMIVRHSALDLIVNFIVLSDVYQINVKICSQI